MRKKVFVIALLAQLLVGCATKQWMHNNPSANFAADSFACENEAAMRHPYPRSVPVQEPSSYNTNCNRLGNSLSCQTTPTASAGSSQVNSQLYEMAAKPGIDISRGIYKNSCLESKGWRLQEVEKSKMDAAEIAKRRGEIEQKLMDVCSLDDLKAYFNKSPCMAKDITFAFLVDETKITTEEKQVFLKAQKMLSSLEPEREQFLMNSGPGGQKVVNVLRTFYKPENEKNALSLYSGAISWGEFNKRRKDIYEEARNK